MEKVLGAKVVTTLAAAESALPPQIQEALGELVGAAREGLLALSVGVGLGVVHELMELEVDEVVGPKSKHDPARTAKRHGHGDGAMTLGGGGWRCAGRGSGRPTTGASCRSRRMSTSPAATR